MSKKRTAVFSAGYYWSSSGSFLVIVDGRIADLEQVRPHKHNNTIIGDANKRLCQWLSCWSQPTVIKANITSTVIQLTEFVGARIQLSSLKQQYHLNTMVVLVPKYFNIVLFGHLKL